MSDEELIARWDDYVESMGSVMGEIEHMAQQMRDRIEALVKELSVSNEIGRAFEEDAGQQRAYVEQLEAALRQLLIAADGETYAEYLDAIENGYAALKGADSD